MSKPVICIVHEGRAAYPEVKAYKRFFQNDYITIESSFRDLKTRAPCSVYWYLMGFFPRRPNSGLVIHDYRSLSVGAFRRCKDIVKRRYNAVPDIRIFQNDQIRRELGFRCDWRTFFLPMGVSDTFVEARGLPVTEPTIDFVYIGSMLADRRCDFMIDSFLKRFGTSRKLYLYGPSNYQLIRRYRGDPNIVFGGFLDQDELPLILRSARVAVNYIPNWFPYVLQTSTKLIEYAALGMRILSNEQPQSRITSELYGISCLWGPPEDMFRDISDDLDWADNSALDPRQMCWSSVLRASGIGQAIQSALL